MAPLGFAGMGNEPGWDRWTGNAATWFAEGGISTDHVRFCPKATFRGRIGERDRSVYYHLCHGGPTSFLAGNGEPISATEVAAWVGSGSAKRFAFIGSCMGLGRKGRGTLSGAFLAADEAPRRKAALGYVSEGRGTQVAPDNRWWYASFGWQHLAFSMIFRQRTPVQRAFKAAEAQFPDIRRHWDFFGDQAFTLTGAGMDASQVAERRARVALGLAVASAGGLGALLLAGMPLWYPVAPAAALALIWAFVELARFRLARGGLRAGKATGRSGVMEIGSGEMLRLAAEVTAELETLARAQGRTTVADHVHELVFDASVSEAGEIGGRPSSLVFRRVVEGVDVDGNEVVVEVDPTSGERRIVTDRVSPDLAVGRVWTVGREEAMEVVRGWAEQAGSSLCSVGGVERVAVVGARRACLPGNLPQELPLDQPVYRPRPEDYVTAWVVTVQLGFRSEGQSYRTSFDVLVDPETGRIITSLPMTPAIPDEVKE